MSTGSVRSPPLPAGKAGSRVSVTKSSFRAASDVEEANVLGVAGDERATRLDVLTHQDREQLIGGGGVVQRDLQEHPVGRVHRGLPQLRGVHLAEALVAPDALFLGQLLARLTTRLDEALQLAIGVGELRLGAPTPPLDLVERRLREEDV